MMLRLAVTANRAPLEVIEVSINFFYLFIAKPQNLRIFRLAQAISLDFVKMVSEYFLDRDPSIKRRRVARCQVYTQRLLPLMMKSRKRRKIVEEVVPEPIL